MNCEHYQVMLSEFLDNELTPEEGTPLFAHLSECASCREALQEFINVRVTLRSSGEEEVEREQQPRVRYHDSPARRGHVFRRRITVPVPAVVLVCTAFLASLLFIIASAFTGEGKHAPQRNVYVITEPIEVRGYYSTQMQKQQ